MNLKSFQEANWQKYAFLVDIGTGGIGIFLQNPFLLTLGFLGMTILFVLTLMEE